MVYRRIFYFYENLNNMFKKILPILGLSVLMFSCDSSKKGAADMLVFNADVYTVDSTFSSATAFAVKDGKFLEIGTAEDLKDKYEFKQEIDANGKAIFPGFIDAHTHFYRLGLQQQKVDLTGTKSFAEVVQKIVDFQKERNSDFITGRGWDQNDWEVKEFPTKDTLDILFPDTPIAITRIDGHALLANQAALDKAGITLDTKASGWRDRS